MQDEKIKLQNNLQNIKPIRICPNCTLENPKILNKCQICDYIIIKESWKCIICLQVNNFNLEFCSKCGTEDPTGLPTNDLVNAYNNNCEASDNTKYNDNNNDNNDNNLVKLLTDED